MDRGVKIAIFAASVISLALGLIWDQVLSQARTLAPAERVDELGSELISATIGPANIARIEAPDFPVQPPQAHAPAAAQQSLREAPPVAPSRQADPGAEWLEYVLQPNEGPDRVSKKFRDRGLTPEDIKNANPDCKWWVGDKVRIPPAAGTNARSAADVPPRSTAREPVTYTVLDGDSWWRIAEKHNSRQVTWQDIQAANPQVSTLRAGMKIKIP